MSHPPPLPLITFPSLNLSTLFLLCQWFLVYPSCVSFADTCVLPMLPSFLHKEVHYRCFFCTLLVVLNHIILKITPYQFIQVSLFFFTPKHCVDIPVYTIILLCIEIQVVSNTLQLRIICILILLKANLQGKFPEGELLSQEVNT